MRGGVLFPDGIPPAWRGADLEAHGLPAGPDTQGVVRRALARPTPAVLWEVEGDRSCSPHRLSIRPGATEGSSGEALWRTAIS